MVAETDALTPDSLPMPASRANNFWYVSNDADTAVIFVHGVFSSSRSCWLFVDHVTGRKVFWPDLVRKDPRLGNPSIYLAGYHTSVESGDYSLTECATELRDALRLRNTDQARAPLDYPRVVFVCHSTGGIITRYLLNRYKGEFRDKGVGLALMASPSLGSEWADVFALAAKRHNHDLGRQLSWDDSALKDLHWQFSELVDRRQTEMPGLFGREAAEHHMIGPRGLWKVIRWLFSPPDSVVSKVSAAQYFGQVRQIAGTDHFSIVKPDGLDHPSHEFLVGFLTDFRRVASLLPTAGPVTPSPVVHEDPVVRTLGGKAVSAAHAAGLDLAGWPEADEEIVYFFLADAGLNATSGTTVVACVVVDDIATLERRWATAIGSMVEDPQLSAMPNVLQGIRRQQFGYREAIPALRVKISELLQTLTFEAYVGFTEKNGEDRGNYARLVRGVVFDRLRAYRTREIRITAQATSQSSRAVVSSVIDAGVAEVRQMHRDGFALPPNFSTLPTAFPGVVIAEYVAEIVLERLALGSAARAFELVHPTKLRVIYDLESGNFFTRKRPFPR